MIGASLALPGIEWASQRGLCRDSDWFLLCDHLHKWRRSVLFCYLAALSSSTHRKSLTASSCINLSITIHLYQIATPLSSFSSLPFSPPHLISYFFVNFIKKIIESSFYTSLHTLHSTFASFLMLSSSIKSILPHDLDCLMSQPITSILSEEIVNIIR